MAVAVARAQVRLLLAAQLGEPAQQVGLLLVQPRRDDDVDVHHEVALAVDPAGRAQPRHALAAQRAHRPGLGAGLDVQLLAAAQRRQLQRGAQGRGRHRQLDRAVQVAPSRVKTLVGHLVHLDVQVARRAAARADLALVGQPHPHAVRDAGRDAARRRCAGSAPGPSPPHCRHGSGMTSPKPRQIGHGRVVTTWPRNERCTLCTSPRPPQMSQVVGRLPGAAPEPVALGAQRRRCRRPGPG